MIICVYAIMRDERDNVAAWAESTGDADHRFVLDTGSTDDTMSELRLNGVSWRAATFEPFRFDDARNCALACAPEADLYLRLD
ncbi:MAG TPA: glycosyl transferase family 2, partial [Vicinamibacteria bacterium]|nr:glycosyl transferase family 2 [Vicinamibacteria bacterium]